MVRPGKLSIIGNGVVIDPWAFAEEIDRLAEQGLSITPDSLMIADNAALILPLHVELDRIREAARGAQKIGTTGRGIGPAYEDKIARRSVRICDLADADTLARRIDAVLEHHDVLRRGLGEPPIDREALVKDLLGIAPRVLPYVDCVWKQLDVARQVGRRILFEGAQGAMLDVDHGTYPFVTSSNTVAGQAAAGSGTGPRALNTVLGIVKVYTTRVGSGPFPTELEDEIGQRLGERGHEFGTVTGRRRRCGWFDAVLVRQAVKIGGIDGIAFTKLDVLDGFDTLKICVGYRIGNEHYDHLPANTELQAQVEPIYETFEGWQESTQGARSWADLPAATVKYVRRVEELIGAPVHLLSTSPSATTRFWCAIPLQDSCLRACRPGLRRLNHSGLRRRAAFALV